MNRAERLNAVLDLLAADGQVEVDDIVSRLDVSPATARRDLDTLAAQNLLTRTRGGAIGQTVAYDLPLRYKLQQHAEEKSAIARAASAMTPRGAVVGLSGGTTSTVIASALGIRPDLAEAGPQANLTVVTNAINIASQLAMRPQIKTVMTGGVVHARSYELVGDYAAAVLNSVTLDIAFIGANGLDPVLGATTHDEREASVNRLMASRAARAVLVTDSSKIGKKAFAAMGDARLFGTVITDAGITAEQRAALTEHGYDVIIAQ
ncbi:DeoR/GlpR family DNA-binding transcription regulator [Microterricola viridarii]|uniref:Transcriptional regulator, DeoR family n=1 Tax=Microterricola viridarii TaxID=412690 RepID=A0A1H1QJI1_9MICO|nr:DeoR/GlpR family DNA-binding transcription regulator [Microterricola viridarii]SDS23556.1 transcriptional regulator, DeoR family [Microterricola viridarii]